MENLKSLLFILMALSIFSMHSHASEVNNNYKPYLYPNIYSQCKNVQYEMDINECVVTEINKALAYLGKIEVEHKKSKTYESAANSWLEFTYSTCEFENRQFFEANGSGMRNRRVSECQLRLIIYRINVVKKYIACEKNDKCADNVPSFSEIITSKQ
jgi:hypothetical protein